jgi:hypothetical protein
MEHSCRCDSSSSETVPEVRYHRVRWDIGRPQRAGMIQMHPSAAGEWLKWSDTPDRRFSWTSTRTPLCAPLPIKTVLVATHAPQSRRLCRAWSHRPSRRWQTYSVRSYARRVRDMSLTHLSHSDVVKIERGCPYCAPSRRAQTAKREFSFEVKTAR